MELLNGWAPAGFVLARVAEWETAARVAGRSGFPTRSYDPAWTVQAVNARIIRAGAGPDTGGHIAAHDPARVLAQCEAFTAIVSLRKAMSSGIASLRDPAEELRARDTLAGLNSAVLALASIWSDHPDYQEGWFE